MSNIYVHIGLHKTGTTPMQIFLSNNRETLLAKGVLYPNAGKTKRFPYAHHNFAWEINKDKRYEPTEHDQWDSLYKEIDSKKSDVTIVSSECFNENFGAEEIKVLRNKLIRYQTKIVIYLRRQDIWYQSIYKQWIKSGKSDRSFKEFVDILDKQEKGDYYQLINLWGKYFGKDNIIVKIYKEKHSPKWLIEDFLSIFKINIEFKAQKCLNISPDIKTIKIMRLLNKILCRKILNTLRLFLFKHLGKRRGMLNKVIMKIPNSLISDQLGTSEELKRILTKYENSNKKVVQEYLKMSEKNLFYQNNQ